MLTKYEIEEEEMEKIEVEKNEAGIYMNYEVSYDGIYLREIPF